MAQKVVLFSAVPLLEAEILKILKRLRRLNIKIQFKLKSLYMQYNAYKLNIEKDGINSK